MGFARCQGQVEGTFQMKRMIAVALSGLSLLVASPVLAQAASGTVVELYTSQGCSSCPPADAYLTRLSQEPGVIALALHVDYWDYIGWEDKFASPKYSDRQRAYARASGTSTIYTPQMIIQGKDQAVGSDPDAVAGMIRRHQSAESMVVLQLMRDGGTVSIRAAARVALSAPLIVQLVRYKPTARVAIERGENAGRTIEYTNIVTSWARIGKWDGASDLVMDAPAPGGDAVVVILQEEGPGMIFAASSVK
jgi:hypothetical protein